MNRNLVEIALQELEAEDRALLELSVVRGVSDGDIAELLGVDVARVLIKREEALGRVSALIGDDPENVVSTMRGLPTARWRDGDEPRQPPPLPEPEPDPPSKPDDNGGFKLALLGGLAVTLVVVVILALNGDDDEPASEPTPTEEAAASGPAALEPVGESPARGTARIEGGRLELSVRGLPRAGYVVWLYDSVTDARALAGARSGNFRVTPRLPADYRRYRFIDVSREPADGNRNHSGQSVLRLPTAGLR